MVRSFLVVVLLVVSSHANADPAPAAPASTEPDDEVSGGRWWASVPLATTFGLVGVAGGAILGYLALGCQDEGTGCNTGPDNGEAIVAVAAGAVGASLGAYVGGLRSDSEGNLGKNLLVTAIPAVVAMFAVAFADDGNNEDVTSGVIVASMISLPIVSTIVDGSSRKRRGPIKRRHERLEHAVDMAGQDNRPRLSFDVPVSTNLGLGAGYCHPLGDQIAACGRAGYRVEESLFVDLGTNEDAVHLAAGLRYLPSDYVRLEVGAMGLTTRLVESQSREYHAGGYTSALLGYERMFVGPELRVLGRFDDLTQLVFVARYELPL